MLGGVRDSCSPEAMASGGTSQRVDGNGPKVELEAEAAMARADAASDVAASDDLGAESSAAANTDVTADALAPRLLRRPCPRRQRPRAAGLVLHVAAGDGRVGESITSAVVPLSP